jgi:hypothetical protein
MAKRKKKVGKPTKSIARRLKPRRCRTPAACSPIYEL